MRITLYQSMAKIPKFKSEKEERKFWDTHDSTEYWEDTEEVGSFELSKELKEQIKEKAQKKRHLTIRKGVALAMRNEQVKQETSLV